MPAGRARWIARAAADAPINEQHLAERAQVEGHEEFLRTVARHVADRSGDDGASLLDRQRRQRAASAFTRPETGMTVVNGQFDPITAATPTLTPAATCSNHQPNSPQATRRHQPRDHQPNMAASDASDRRTMSTIF
ncbi:hypothetical protein [Candidatus Poriferisodalis sp.]|uniref:hypothetical protein n=1 Tax=Candidatus Poriferisodalis sp. TaxID=3101277 RepID=UPI003B02A365